MVIAITTEVELQGLHLISIGEPHLTSYLFYILDSYILFLFEEKVFSLETKPGSFPESPGVETSPSNSGGAGLIPGWGAKISHATTKIPRATETPGSQINQSVFFKKELGKKSPRWGGSAP